MSADLEKLLPCPFCGGEAHLSRYHAYSTDSSFDFVGCKACYALIMCEDGRDGKAEAISEWNRRAPDLARQVIALTADNAALRAKAEKLAEELDSMCGALHAEGDAHLATKAKVARLMEAAAPFSGMAGEMFARNWNKDSVAISFVTPDGPIRLTFAHFLALRQALTEWRKSYE